MGGQLDGNFLPGSLPHKFILIVTLMICFAVNKFLSLAPPGLCRSVHHLDTGVIAYARDSTP